MIVRKKKEEDKEAYENSDKLWLDQKYEIENELKEAKDMIEIVGASGCISYDGVNNLQTTLLILINYFNDIFCNILLN